MTNQIQELDRTIKTLEAIISTLLKNRTECISIDELNDTRIQLIKDVKLLKVPMYEALKV